MRPVESQKQLITAAVTGALGDLLSGVGDGLPKARPLPGKAGVIIEWPRIEWPTWNTDDPDVTWTLVIVPARPPPRPPSRRSWSTARSGSPAR